MAKIACSGCGDLKVVPAGKTEVLCHPCRRTRKQKSCEVCGTDFTTYRLGYDACGQECGKVLASRRHPNPNYGKPKTSRPCEGCGEDFIPNRETRPQKCCSRECGVKVRPPRARKEPELKVIEINEVACAECGDPTIYVGVPKKYCSDECSKTVHNRRALKRILNKYHSNPAYRDEVLARAHARRADKLGLGSAKVVLSHLIERDEKVCGICSALVVDTTGPMKPSIDHIIPLSRGGEHSMTNVQLSHYRCNLSKNNKLESEMAA
ncbi:HNH endonuclease [Nonomuraea sp. K274]|uniref:HNH endonuclease n=1 Tax=Nonomuraea cypriaca TaxID=1187855 RepID=A0A931AA68_9ACTN|nr:HNH endonuclease [Nonomuraea cypriaca]MBF8189116.1 HNH endonuclease [Nonomuraea cypriaca]